MKILIAEDEAVSRAKLLALLNAQGHDVTATEDGMEAWGAWQIAQPRVVVSDWAMPELDGLELCRRLRAHQADHYTYFILLTATGGRENFLAAMEAGIDDFITKPVDPEELRARLTVAQRILGLREELSALEGLLPICSYCKRIRNDRQEWSSLEGYIEKRSKAEFSHGVCPDCYKKHLEPHLGPP
jgi:DNA-binding response OmpR family regulator